GRLSSVGSLRGSPSEGCQALRSASPAADQVRAGDQSQDREGARPRHPAQAARARRRGDRMTRREKGWPRGNLRDRRCQTISSQRSDARVPSRRRRRTCLASGGIMLTIRMIVAVTALVTTIAQSRAPSWPTRPVTIVYPFAAGSAGDVLGRIFASRLSELLGQPVLFENVGG